MGVRRLITFIGMFSESGLLVYEYLFEIVGLVGSAIMLCGVYYIRPIFESINRNNENLMLFRELVDQSNDAILVIDPKTSKFVDVNDTACHYLGYARDELLSIKSIEIESFIADDLAWKAHVDEVRKKGYLVVQGKYRRNDGSEFPAEKNVKYISHDRQDYMVAVVRDITEQSQAQQKLRQSEKRLRDVTSYLGEGIYVLDAHGKITFMNPEAERLLGWTKEEMNAAGAHECAHHHRPDGTPYPAQSCKMLNVIKSGERYASTEEAFWRKDGTFFPISVITTPIFENDKIVASVTAFRDITDEKKMEKELLKVQKLESLGIFAGGIAHDFNNLLQAIVGYINLVKISLFQKSPEKIVRFLDQAEAAVETAKELSFRLLTFAKGGAPIRTISSIEGILRKSISLSLSGSNLESDIVVAADLCPVEIDEGQMIQVFNNILINAREAMPQGGTIKVSARNVEVTASDGLPLQEGAYVLVTIEDKGIGISKANLGKIFDPYFSTKDKRGQKGSGLGLSICLSIVKKHEGHVSVESQEGEGTTFRIYIPATRTLPVELGPDRIAAIASPGKMRLLFMDDDDMIRDFVLEMAAYLGHEAAFAKNGEEAVELYKKAREAGERFDVVILDLTVQGGMGGDIAVEELLRIDQTVKAVISSGYSDSPIIKNYRSYGFVDAIAKPYRIDELRELLARVTGSPLAES